MNRHKMGRIWLGLVVLSFLSSEMQAIQPGAPEAGSSQPDIYAALEVPGVPEALGLLYNIFKGPDGTEQDFLNKFFSIFESPDTFIPFQPINYEAFRVPGVSNALTRLYEVFRGPDLSPLMTSGFMDKFFSTFGGPRTSQPGISQSVVSQPIASQSSVPEPVFSQPGAFELAALQAPETQAQQATFEFAPEDSIYTVQRAWAPEEWKPLTGGQLIKEVKGKPDQFLMIENPFERKITLPSGEEKIVLDPHPIEAERGEYKIKSRLIPKSDVQTIPADEAVVSQPGGFSGTLDEYRNYSGPPRKLHPTIKEYAPSGHEYVDLTLQDLLQPGEFANKLAEKFVVRFNQGNLILPPNTPVLPHETDYRKRGSAIHNLILQHPDQLQAFDMLIRSYSRVMGGEDLPSATVKYRPETQQDLEKAVDEGKAFIGPTGYSDFHSDLYYIEGEPVPPRSY